MRRLLLIVLLLFAPLAVALAGDEPRLEAFGGYSWLSTSLFQDTGFLPAREGLSGFDSSLGWNITHNLGVVGEGGGYFGTPSQNSTAVRARYYSFFAGPKITHHNHSDNFEVFIHQLFGMSHATLNSATRSFASTGFSMEAGFGMDVVLRKYVSIRPLQVDYMISQLTYHTQNQFRVSAGVVFRWKFGERRSASGPRPPEGSPDAVDPSKNAANAVRGSGMADASD